MIQTSKLTKTYTKSNVELHAIDRLDLHIEEGDFAVIYGHSGCGKSTLLLMLGGMLHPTSGQIRFNGEDLYRQSSRFLRKYRKNIAGFLFQRFYLMPYLNVMDNIRLSLKTRNDHHENTKKIESLTHSLGIHERLSHLPEELSMGEQQRAALTRTLAGNPRIILADEPTGNLDKENTEIIASCLKEENQKGKTIILATHDESLIELGNKKIHLQSGRDIPIANTVKE